MAARCLNLFSSQSNSSPSIFTDCVSEISERSSPPLLELNDDHNPSLDRLQTDTTMDAVDGTEDVTAVMNQILLQMSRLVEHLRDNGENEAANSIARDTVSIIKVFNTATAPWDHTTATMHVASPSAPASTMPTQATPQQDKYTHGTLPLSHKDKPTWATIAAAQPEPGNKLVRSKPSDNVGVKSGDVQSVCAESLGDTNTRVVWIRGWPAHRPLGEVTDRIGQGPIYSMAYSDKDSSVCIIFQYAGSAKALCSDDHQYTKDHGYSRFGPGCDVFEGLPFPENDDMRRMLIPLNERRRLTFARQQLFANGMTEERFKNDIFSVVGQRNVELVWLFNTGNATVVFSAVPLARLVRNEFIKLAKNPGSPYHGVGISFSHDPCERPMSLITQMPAGRSVRAVGTYGRDGVVPVGVISKSGPISRRNTINEVNGWQTVSKRR